MKYIKLFEEHSEEKKILIIVDVQRSFKKFITDNYLKELNNYCKEFDEVINIWDNHIDGKNPDKDFLYHSEPDIENTDDLYTFPKEIMKLEKRYKYNVKIDYFKNILSDEDYKTIKNKEDKGLLKKGDKFNTTEDTVLVYIGNNHRWFQVGKKMFKLFKTLKGKKVTVVGGANGECILDIQVSAKTLGVNLFTNKKYVYSATYCPV